jgi:hypothetical protein
VAHACNPSYSGSRDQEDRGSKPSPTNSSAKPYLKKSFTKISPVEWLRVKVLSSTLTTERERERERERDRETEREEGVPHIP